MYAFRLTTMAPGKTPYQGQVGNPVPLDAVPLVFSGSRLPAKFMPEGIAEEVVIDCKAALAIFTSG
jgi:hypothetical protein